jgi:serine/threonine protein kinase/Tfp pilus assembly protein PilF
MPLSTTDTVLARLVAAGGFLPAEALEAAIAIATAENIPLRDALLRSGTAPDVLASLEAAARSASAAGGPRAPSSSAETMASPGSSAQTVFPSDAATKRSTRPDPERPASSSPTMLSPNSEPAGRTAVSPSSPSLPRRLGRLDRVGKYEIIDELGRGGMGVVYKARHPGLDRVVALKTLIATGSEEHVERFLREARAAARMGKHPNLVQVHDVGEENGVYYFTMEYIEGQAFDREIHVDKVPPRRVAEVVEAVARGLAQAHAEGIVHRDLKPANVLIDLTRRPLLTDFGLAKEVGSGSSVSVAGQILGTPAYMSPEQAEGKLDQVNEKSDVYGLGTVLYEGLTRHAPFAGNGNIEILRKVTGEEPVHPSSLSADIPRDLEVICLKCLAKRPEDRYESAAAVADDLDRFLKGDPILARPIPWTVRIARKALKNRLVSVLSLAAVALLVAGSFLGIKLIREKSEKERERVRLAGEEQAREAKRRAEELARDAKRKVVEDHVLAGRQSLEKAEKAMRPDVVAIAGTSTNREPLDASLAELDAALAEDPSHFEARRLRARALRLGGNVEEAVAESDRALALRPDDAAALYDKTLAALDLYRSAKGQVSVVDYSHFLSLGGQGQRRVVLHRDPRADEMRAKVAEDLQKLAKAGLAESQARYAEGILAQLDGRPADAIAAYDKALEADRFLIEAVRAKAEALVELKKYGEARDAYGDLVKALPFDPLLRASLAGLQESYEAAVPHLDKTVDLAPKAAWAYRERGLIHLMYDRREAADHDLKKALELDPTDANAMEGMFMASSLIGEGDVAEAWGRKALAVDGEDYDLWFQMGIFLRTVGKSPEAIACFDKALEADPKFGLYLWARGRTRLQDGQYTEGMRDMFDAVALGDMSPTARKMFDNTRKMLEKQIEGIKEPAKVAALAEQIIGLLKLLISMSGDDRRKQYESSIHTLHWVASDMYEKAEKWDEALLAIKDFPEPASYDWAVSYRRARICAEKADFEESKRQLRICRDHGMARLGAVRMDWGFHRLRDTDGWAAFAAEF